MARSSTSFKLGVSGNPGGRPKLLAEVTELARRYDTAAIETLVRIITDRDAHAVTRVAAANAILDRGWGKPSTTVQQDQTPYYGKNIIQVVTAGTA